MAKREKWLQLRMTELELAKIDRIMAARDMENRADVIRSLVADELKRLDKAESRSRKIRDSEE